MSGWRVLPALAKCYVVNALDSAQTGFFFVALGFAETISLLEFMGPDTAGNELLCLTHKSNRIYRWLSFVAILLSKMDPSAAVRVMGDILSVDVPLILMHMKNLAAQKTLIEVGLFLDMEVTEVARALKWVDCRVAADYVQSLDAEDAAETLTIMDAPSAATILEVMDRDASAFALKAIPNDRTLAAIVNELPTKMAQQVMQTFEIEQKTAVMWEAAHLELGCRTEPINATYNFAWSDLPPWSASPKSYADSFEEEYSLGRSSDWSSDRSEDDASSCDGVSAEALDFARRRREDTGDLLPMKEYSYLHGVRWMKWT